MPISEASPYQNFNFALKSKDVKRHYPSISKGTEYRTIDDFIDDV